MSCFACHMWNYWKPHISDWGKLAASMSVYTYLMHTAERWAQAYSLQVYNNVHVDLCSVFWQLYSNLYREQNSRLQRRADVFSIIDLIIVIVSCRGRVCDSFWCLSVMHTLVHNCICIMYLGVRQATNVCLHNHAHHICLYAQIVQLSDYKSSDKSTLYYNLTLKMIGSA